LDFPLLYIFELELYYKQLAYRLNQQPSRRASKSLHPRLNLHILWELTAGLLISLIYLSNETSIDNPKFIRKYKKKITCKRKRTKKKGSNNRKKTKAKLAKKWSDHNNVKVDWQWKFAKELILQYDFIA
jgi:hypothetical protein